VAPKKPNTAQRVTALRESLGINQAKFAKALGVTHPLVSQCESGDREPSTDMLIRLGKVAVNSGSYDDAKWFWEKAGLDMKTLDAFVDQHAKDHYAAAPEFVTVEPLEEGGETISFSARMLDHRASTRCVRLGHSEPPFGRGDIILIDTHVTDLREAADGDIFAIQHGKAASSAFSLSIGVLVKKQVSAEPVFHFVIERPHGDLLIGSSRGDGDTEIVIPVVGKVVAWMHGTGEHAQYRHWDREGAFAIKKLRASEQGKK
jgi:transcriptional regulator with XRE-family HTH domain